MGGKQSILAPLARRAIQLAAKRDLAAFQRLHPELTIPSADLVDFNYLSARQATGTIRFQVRRSIDAVTGLDDRIDAPPGDEDCFRWHYEATPSRDATNQEQDEWVAQRIEDEEAVWKAATQPNGGKPRATNKVATL